MNVPHSIRPSNLPLSIKHREATIIFPIALLNSLCECNSTIYSNTCFKFVTEIVSNILCGPLKLVATALYYLSTIDKISVTNLKHR